jgi:hypothetical protein
VHVTRALLVVLSLTALTRAARADECETARAQLAKKDLVRASIAAAACDDAIVVAEVETKAAAAGYSPVEIVTRPAGGTVIVEPAPDLPFTAPRKVWLPEGRHQVVGLVDGEGVATALVIARDGNRTAALIELPGAPPPPGTQEVDFGEEGGGEMQSGPPEKVEFASLLPERYQRGVAVTETDDDPRGSPPPHLWTMTFGGLAGSNDAFGLGFGFEHGFEISSVVAFVPQIFAQALSVPDETGDRRAVVGIHADGAVRLMTRLAPHWRGGVRAGPSFSLDKGMDDYDGATLGVAASGEVESRRRYLALLRLEVPLWHGAEERLITTALYLGRRW